MKKANQVIYIDNTPMYVRIAEELMIVRSVCRVEEITTETQTRPRRGRR